MKTITIGLIALCFAGCGESKNQLMTKLINEKRDLSDSLKIAEGGKAMFESKSKEAAHTTHDSLVYLPLLDSSFKYSNLAFRFKEKLKALDFSIDSLTKMR